MNVQSGGGRRWSAILDFVDGHDPDVVVFAEWRRNVLPGSAEAWASGRDMKWIGAWAPRSDPPSGRTTANHHPTPAIPVLPPTSRHRHTLNALRIAGRAIHGVTSARLSAERNLRYVLPL
jgi:hypothetical protein